ncbi:D-alanyl-D-alanine carboxypeptidase (penicillin-binding protein 5/6) [Paenibacillus methanolicus]|uniref:D-alanyl-D-alanine carboxypeptidase (Penicillin-binding protein 5/6) n=1 Tax=Paenibacillus methanolicus TaxID=582686 RepID=A0A5S5BUA9_9BACL|nr:D-alanyl-D-alanine carboxypeptidase (penicillin-binding protein 5/6) [Paenibacillus methanolicus]
MLRCLCICIMIMLLGTSLPRGLRAEESIPQPPELQSEAAILIDARSGAVLFGKNATERLYPASITKIVTGIIALESADPEEIVTVSKEARYEDGTRVYLAEGEQVTLGNLVYALMLNSGNDAATAIAEHISGSKALFADKMNAFAKETVGVFDTQFTNPHGLPDPAHYTTASDMAKIAQYAMRNERFREIVATDKMPWNGKEWQSQLDNHNKLLTTYEGTLGVKNGYTQAAGNTLVIAAQRGGMELIGVILKASTNKAIYAEMTKLLDYGFAAFEPRQLFAAGETYKYGTGAEGESPRMFVAEEELWTAAPKHEIADMQVDALGSVTMSTPSRTWTAGMLTLQTPPAESAQAVEAGSEAAGAAEDIEEEKAVAASGWELPIAGAWLLMNIMLGAIAYMKLRKRAMRGA